MSGWEEMQHSTILTQKEQFMIYLFALLHTLYFRFFMMISNIGNYALLLNSWRNLKENMNTHLVFESNVSEMMLL